MKLFYTLLGLCVLGLAFGSFYYTNMRKEVAEFKAATSTPETSSLYIYREYGDISFKNKTSNDYTHVLDEKMKISNYAAVKTGDGRGYVIMPDNSSITLGTSTELEINYEPTKVSIMQVLGSTYHRVSALATGSKYEVRTPNTLAAIRGTKFAVIYNPKTKKTLVVVTEHSVEVTQTKEDGSLSKASVIVQEGSLADVQSSTSTIKNGTSTPGSGSVLVRPINDIKEIKLFIDENKVIDKEYDKAPLPERRLFLEKIINSLHMEPIFATSTSSTKPETRVEAITKIVSGTTRGTPTAQIPTRTQSVSPETSPNSNPTTATVLRNVPTTLPIAPQSSGPLRNLPVAAEELTPLDEAFVDSFYAVYERYFLVNDPTVYCRKISGMTAKDMVNTLLDVTNKAGIVLPKQSELVSFASDLISSCADNSIVDKATSFKTRFDITYPY